MVEHWSEIRGFHQAARRLPPMGARTPAGDPDWKQQATIDALRQLWDAGDSTALIAAKMGTSKNAIVGKAHRLNLPSRPSPILQATGRRKLRKLTTDSRIEATRIVSEIAYLPSLATQVPRTQGSETQVLMPPVAPLIAPVMPPLPRHKCLWPSGDGWHITFDCQDRQHVVLRNGEQVVKPYCRFHCSLAYLPVRDLRIPDKITRPTGSVERFGP